MTLEIISDKDGGVIFVFFGKKVEKPELCLRLLGYVQSCYAFVTQYPNKDDMFLRMLSCMKILGECCEVIRQSNIVLGLHRFASECVKFLYDMEFVLRFPHENIFLRAVIAQFQIVMQSPTKL